jgi:DNA repair protein RadA/Sms
VARPQSRYVCQTCGESFLRWEGQCRGCGAWNTLVETVVSRGGPGGNRPSGVAAAQPTPLRDVGADLAARTSTGIAELDRVLGGGLVAGSLVVLGGEPGIGKSTLLLQAAAGVAAADLTAHGIHSTVGAPTGGSGGEVLYATAEESAAQIRLRALRLGILDGPAGARIHVIAESDVGRIAELARSARPSLLVVDSVQTIRVDDLDGPAGSVGQVRESAARLQELAKGDGIPVVLVGHVTKDGSLAGPKTLEHLVDVVLGLEGERYAGLRLLRVAKNRFGSTEEVGVFEMREQGLAEVADPARAFLVDHDERAPGSIVAPTLEGTRPLLVEVQALVAPTGYGTPTRRASGLDPNRLALLLAVLGRRAGIGLGSHDVYANLAGGVSLDDPGLDLPLAMALASSLRDRPIAPDTIAIGEVGLLGELRGVPGLERRLREAARLGFHRAIVPAAATVTERSASRGDRASADGLALVAVGSLREALEAVISRPERRARASQVVDRPQTPVRSPSDGGR